jgi:oligoendopeptidase F
MGGNGQPPAEAKNAARDLGFLPTWDLADLYPGTTAPAIADDLSRAAAEAERIKARYQGKLVALGREGAALAEAIVAYERLSEIVGKLGSYASLLYASNTNNPEYAKFYGDIQEKITAITSDVIFFELELNQIAEEDLAQAFKVPALEHYQPWIADLRREKPYQLDERLERLLHEKAITSRGAWSRLFSETMTGLRCRVAGEKEPLSIEPTLNLLVHPEEAKRHAAADALATAFKANARLLTLITNTLAKDKEIGDRWRGFKHVADSRHLANRVEPEVVEALVDTVRAAYPQTSHRYYAMKARWLGKDRLNYWDRNAPLPESPGRSVERSVAWAEAQRMVLAAYAAFAPDLAGIAKRFFDGGWIDAPLREGKAPGAFSHPTVPSVHPYILLNYQGKPRDVMTLAHELGHGLHQVLAAPQGALLAATPLTLAETASVFGEMLTFHALLESANTPWQRKALLVQKVEDMINTVVRQIAFYCFEVRAHEERKAGELTSERLGQIWLEVQSESLGPAFELTQGYETYWSYIPHFVHSPFYVYAYAFGDCLVNSLYSLYREAHPGFVGKYLAMLEAGGSRHYSELLKPFGLDPRTREFWKKGLAVLTGFIDEIEELNARDAA